LNRSNFHKDVTNCNAEKTTIIILRGGVRRNDSRTW